MKVGEQRWIKTKRRTTDRRLEELKETGGIEEGRRKKNLPKGRNGEERGKEINRNKFGGMTARRKTMYKRQRKRSRNKTGTERETETETAIKTERDIFVSKGRRSKKEEMHVSRP